MTSVIWNSKNLLRANKNASYTFAIVLKLRNFTTNVRFIRLTYLPLRPHPRGWRPMRMLSSTSSPFSRTVKAQIKPITSLNWRPYDAARTIGLKNDLFSRTCRVWKSSRPSDRKLTWLNYAISVQDETGQLMISQVTSSWLNNIGIYHYVLLHSVYCDMQNFVVQTWFVSCPKTGLTTTPSWRRCQKG